MYTQIFTYIYIYIFSIYIYIYVYIQYASRNPAALLKTFLVSCKMAFMMYGSVLLWMWASICLHILVLCLFCVIWGPSGVHWGFIQHLDVIGPPNGNKIITKSTYISKYNDKCTPKCLPKRSHGSWKPLCKKPGRSSTGPPGFAKQIEYSREKGGIGMKYDPVWSVMTRSSFL